MITIIVKIKTVYQLGYVCLPFDSLRFILANFIKFLSVGLLIALTNKTFLNKKRGFPGVTKLRREYLLKNIRTFCKDECKDILCPDVSADGSTEEDQGTDEPGPAIQRPDPTSKHLTKVAKKRKGST